MTAGYASGKQLTAPARRSPLAATNNTARARRRPDGGDASGTVAGYSGIEVRAQEWRFAACLRAVTTGTYLRATKTDRMIGRIDEALCQLSRGAEPRIVASAAEQLLAAHQLRSFPTDATIFCTCAGTARRHEVRKSTSLEKTDAEPALTPRLAAPWVSESSSRSLERVRPRLLLDWSVRATQR